MNPFSSLLLLAQDAGPARQSYLHWMYHSLGPFYALVLPLAGLAIFVGACLVVSFSRRPAVIAAYLVFVPLPLLIGIYGSLSGFMSAFTIISMSSVAPKPSEWAAGISTGLFTSLIGLLVSFPAYFVTAIGLFLRTVYWPRKE